MRTLDQQLKYEKLELIASPIRKKQSALQSLRGWVAQIKSHVVRTMVSTEEPQIWTWRNKNGNLIWYVRDAQTRTVNQFGSEEAVRIWLEERHWQ